jgi:hypothetical protein
MSNQLVAISASELQTAQKGVLKHCAGRIRFLMKELAGAEENLEHVRQRKWATAPFKARVTRLTKKIDYFKKIGLAVKKGYLIIPDVWYADIFAIRVKDAARARWSKWGNAHLQLLPSGVGEWISDDPIEHTHSYEKDGKTRTYVWHREAQDEIDFPVVAVHPAVMQASDIAMADRIFDKMKIARHRGDPFILGTIVDPTNRSKEISFFIAWFLDVETL